MNIEIPQTFWSFFIQMINIYQFSEKAFHLSAKSNFIKLNITTYNIHFMKESLIF
jgi:hypothetical protein